MTQDDALFRYRVRLFGLAKEIGVRAACRGVGVHHSSYYRWKSQVDRFGLEILRPRGRRRPRMANQTSPFVEQKVVAFALGHPGFGPARISAELRRDKWGGIVLSPNGVHRVLRRHGLNTRANLVSWRASRPRPSQSHGNRPPNGTLTFPTEMVQMDCFFIGRLSRVKGAVWQYTAIDVGSAYCWGELYVTPRNPSARWTSKLARRVAADLAGPPGGRAGSIARQAPREHWLASEYKGPDDPVFCNRLGRGWTTMHCQDRFKAAVKVAGVRTPGRLSLHSLRHTFASLMIGNGLDVVFVSGQLGHANPTVTLRTHTHLFARAGHAQAARQALESSYEAMAMSSTATSPLPS